MIGVRQLLGLAATLVTAAGATAAVQAAPVRIAGSIAGPHGPISVELAIDGSDGAVLRTTQPGRDGLVDRERLVSPDKVVPLLIDRRLAFLWPALIEWGGPGLERLRQRMLADSAAAFAKGKTAYGSTIVQGMTSRVAAYQERAFLLRAAGERERAIALLREATDDWVSAKKWGRIEQSILLVALANLIAQEERTEDADRLLAEAEGRLGPGIHLLNILVNRASILTRSGRYREALEIADSGAERYTAHAKTIGGTLTTVPGSQRYFASIKACALAGLGRAAEAREALAPALADREPRSLVLKVAQSNSEVRMSAFLCMRDRNALASEVVANVAADPIMPAAFVLMQPAVKLPLTDHAFLAEVRGDPQVIAALRDVARPLPPELVPALNDWRD